MSSPAPAAPTPVKAPDPVPTAPDPEPTPTAPVIDAASTKQKNDGSVADAKKKGTNSLIIPLSIPSAGNGLSIPV